MMSARTLARAMRPGVLLLTLAGLAACEESATEPEPLLDLVETARAAGGFETLLEAAEASGMLTTLAQGGPFTIFAPSDEAFAEFEPSGSRVADHDASDLRELLLHHIVEGELTTSRAVGEAAAPTLGGGTIVIEGTEAGLRVEGVSVARVDLRASNGIIHGIEKVLVP